VTSGRVPNVLALEEDLPFKNAAWRSNSMYCIRVYDLLIPRRPNWSNLVNAINVGGFVKYDYDKKFLFAADKERQLEL